MSKHDKRVLLGLGALLAVEFVLFVVFDYLGWLS